MDFKIGDKVKIICNNKFKYVYTTLGSEGIIQSSGFAKDSVKVKFYKITSKYIDEIGPWDIKIEDIELINPIKFVFKLTKKGELQCK